MMCTCRNSILAVFRRGRGILCVCLVDIILAVTVERMFCFAAAAPMDAVLRFGGHQPADGVPGVTTSGHTIENMAFNAAQLANYSVAATVLSAVGAALSVCGPSP